LEELRANYQDNFWEQLPIEPLKIDRLALPGMGADSDTSPADFEKAEEKAVKAVQKHSMVIVRQERNKQIDDAYLLLGKSRYYSKRFVPALEAFNYIIINYPTADLIDETRVWQAKTQIRLQNEEQAILNLKDLLKKSSIESEIREKAHTALAMAYVALNEPQKTRFHLNSATKTDHNKEQTARNLFILGQMYRDNAIIDSSNFVFQKLIDLKKAPYKYVIRARLEKARNVNDKLDALTAKEELIKLTKDRDNRPYLNEIYYQLGMMESDTELASEYFKKSLESNSTDLLQKEFSYEALGNLYFDKAEFLTAGAYYDSVVNATQMTNSKRVRRLIRKRNKLNEVIYYEGIAKSHDSILRIVDMSKEEREAFFINHIDRLKAIEEKQAVVDNTGTGFLNFRKSGNSNSGKWYFYSVQTVGFGEQEFRKKWGNRPHEHNWRLSDKTQINLGVSSSFESPGIDLNSDRFDLENYMNRVPEERNTIDSLKSERNNAYFRLGIIYKEQFNEKELAIQRLEDLLTFNPVEELVLPAKYHLYKMYDENGSGKALVLRSDIVQNYPESNYAQIILNPNQVIEDNQANLPEKEYAEVFYAYKAEKYDEVITIANTAIGKFEGHAIVPKFELLKAYALGKRDGGEAFYKALEYVAMNYPNTEEGKKALEVKETIKSKI
jgi:tetratricopeptide (TPR) repeat protein